MRHIVTDQIEASLSSFWSSAVSRVLEAHAGRSLIDTCPHGLAG